MLRGKPESQLCRQHLVPPGESRRPHARTIYYSGFITELQRFFCHIGNPWNLNSFGVLQFSIEFALQITWTFKCYDPTNTLEKWWSIMTPISVTCRNLYRSNLMGHTLTYWVTSYSALILNSQRSTNPPKEMCCIPQVLLLLCRRSRSRKSSQSRCWCRCKVWCIKAI